MKCVALAFLALFVCSSIVFAQDTGTRDTLRFQPTETEWLTQADTAVSLEIWAWTDDPDMRGCCCGFRVCVDTAGLDPDLYSVHLDTIPDGRVLWSSSVDSLIYVDTFIFDPGLDADVTPYMRSLLINNDPDPPDGYWGYNGFDFGVYSFLGPPFALNTPTKIGDLYIGILNDSPLVAPLHFSIVVDSFYFPPAGSFKFSAIGGTGFPPDFSKATVEVSTCYLPCGDTDPSGMVDIDDVVCLINYMFVGGRAPDPYELGDVNCSSVVDIDDVLFLINYIFASGYAPCDTDGDGVPDC